MSFAPAWTAIAARVEGIARIAELHSSFLRVRADDTYGVHKELARQCIAVSNAAGTFVKNFKATLPEEVVTRSGEFLPPFNALLADKEGTAQGRQERAWAAVMLLTGFVAEISFLLADTEEQIRSRAELAFEHLQRQIVVDEHVRQAWQTAFAKGEPACEALGSVHLLSHGIFAFKSDGGAKTDLVFPDRKDFGHAERIANGLVLTEWKRGTEAEARRKIDEAQAQARIYAKGVLRGVELVGYRYLVFVSERSVELPPDSRLDEIVYRHINIAVNPEIPSREARRAQ